MLIKLKNISLQYGITPILDNINFNINNNEKIALVGRNGVGKSTLLKLINNYVNFPDKIDLDQGVIEHNASIKVGMLEQDVDKIHEDNIYNIIADGLGEYSNLIKEYNDLNNHNQLTEELLDKLHQVQEQIDHLNIWNKYNEIDIIISKLDIDKSKDFLSLSGGQKRRVLLAKALVSHPDLLLLDEPTNHLDLESIKWLESLLSKWKTSLLFISHDRVFVRKIATRIIELDRGKLLDWPGSYDNFLIKKEEYLKAEELDNIKFDKKLAEEEKWIRQGIKARRTRNEGRVRALKEMRVQKSQRINLQSSVKYIEQDEIKSGNKVIEAKNISFKYNNSNKNLISDFNNIIMRGDKIAIIGPNGVGKTTLINILLKKLAPTTGSIEHGTKLELAYFDQLRQELDPNLSVRDNVSGGSDTVTINNKNKHIIGYLQDFLFTPDRANSKISVLSGGEKNRLLLAKLFTKPSNLLILDEPTNDLDIETLELLEDLLVNYKGTIILISHDREFIDNIATSVLVFEGEGIITEHVGGYSDYEKLFKNKSSDSDSNSNSNSDVKETKSKQNQNLNKNKNTNKTLKALENSIIKLEAEIEEINNIIAEEGFYSKPQNEIDKFIKKLSDKQKNLDELYGKWEELE